jgi:hypothetical protein
MKAPGSSRAYANLFLRRPARKNRISHMGRTLYAQKGEGGLEIANSLAPNGYVSDLFAQGI